jgi:hypothetical protein
LKIKLCEALFLKLEIKLKINVLTNYENIFPHCRSWVWDVFNSALAHLPTEGQQADDAKRSIYLTICHVRIDLYRNY